jgi:hypothetical protein
LKGQQVFSQTVEFVAVSVTASWFVVLFVIIDDCGGVFIQASFFCHHFKCMYIFKKGRTFAEAFSRIQHF